MAEPAERHPVLSIKDLHVWFDGGNGRRVRGRRRGHGGGSSDSSGGGSSSGGGDENLGSHVLQGITLDVAPGERIGLVGESGCGKTTTILAAMGLLPPSATVQGSVLLDGTDILAGGERGMAAHRWTDMAMVFQGAMNSLNPVRTLGWQIAEALRVHRTTDRRAVRHRVDELLDLVGIAASRRGAYPHELSGGMRQRAVIAMALACRPRVLLADEPTTALDVVIQSQILSLLTGLCSELNLALILVTHDLGVVAQTCDRAAVMLGGRIIEQATVNQLYRSAREEYTRSLFAATPSLRDARDITRATTRVPAPVMAPVAAPTSGPATASISAQAGAPQPARAEAPQPLLRVRDLRVSFPGRRSLTDTLHRRPAPRLTAVDGISFDVADGELVALVGQSGCGKTTTAQAILGMESIDSGTMTLTGSPITGLDRRALRTMRRRVQMVYQDPYESLDGRFRVRQTLEEPLRIHGVGDSASRRRLASEALERVALAPASQYLERFPHELSGGQRQRVSIAACLVLQPELLLADEPVSMLDVSLRLGVLDLLNRLRSDSALGILMITHDLSTAAAYADRIVVMHEGRIVEQGTAWDIVNRPQDPYTKTLLASVPDADPAVHAGR